MGEELTTFNGLKLLVFFLLPILLFLADSAECRARVRQPVGGGGDTWHPSRGQPCPPSTEDRTAPWRVGDRHRSVHHTTGGRPGQPRQPGGK